MKVQWTMTLMEYQFSDLDLLQYYWNTNTQSRTESVTCNMLHVILCNIKTSKSKQTLVKSLVEHGNVSPPVGLNQNTKKGLNSANKSSLSENFALSANVAHLCIHGFQTMIKQSPINFPKC